MQTNGILQHWAAAEELYAKHCPLEGFLVLYALLRGGSIPLYRRRVELRTRLRAAEMILFESHPASLVVPEFPLHSSSTTFETSEETVDGKKRKRRRSGPSGGIPDSENNAVHSTIIGSSSPASDPLTSNATVRHNPAQPPTPELARLVLQPIILKAKEYFSETRILMEFTEEERDLQAMCPFARCCPSAHSTVADGCSDQKEDNGNDSESNPPKRKDASVSGEDNGENKSNGWSDDGMIPLSLAVKVHVFLAVACRRRRQFAYAVEILMAAEKFIDDAVRQDPVLAPSSAASTSSSTLRQLAETEVKCCAALVATELCRTLHTIVTYVTENHELGKPMHRPVRGSHAAILSIAPSESVHGSSGVPARSVGAPVDALPRSNGASSQDIGGLPHHTQHMLTVSPVALAASSDLAQREFLRRSGHFSQYVSSTPLSSEVAVELNISRLCFTSALPEAVAFTISCSSTLAAMHILATLALEGTSAHAHHQLSKCERVLGDVPELHMLRYFLEVGYEKSGSLASMKSIMPHAAPAENCASSSSSSRCSWISHGTLAAMQALVDLCHHTTAPLPSTQTLTATAVGTGTAPRNADPMPSADPRWTNRVQQIVDDFNTVLEYVDQHIGAHAASMGRSVGSTTREGSNPKILRSSAEPKNESVEARVKKSVSSALTRNREAEESSSRSRTEQIPHTTPLLAASHTSELRFLVVVKCAAFVEVIRYFLSAMLLKEAFVRLLLLQRFMRVFKRQTSGFLCTVHTLTAEMAMHLGIHHISATGSADDDDSTAETGPDVSYAAPESWGGSEQRSTSHSTFEMGVGIAYSHLSTAELVTSNPALLLRTKLMKCLALYRASQSTDVPHTERTSGHSNEVDGEESHVGHRFPGESGSMETVFSGHTHVSTHARLRQRCAAHAAELLAILKSNYDEFTRLREDSGISEESQDAQPCSEERSVHQAAQKHKYRRQMLTEDQQRTLAAWTTSNCAFFLSLLGAVVLIDSKDEYSSAQYLKNAIAIARQRCGMLSPTVADCLLHLFHAHAAVTGGNTQEGGKALTLATQISARCEYWPCLMHCVALSQEKWCPSLELDVNALLRVLNVWHADVSYITRNMHREVEEVLRFRISA